MSYALNMHSACKIMVASGIAKSDTRDILTTLEREQNGSGSQFLLDRLKTLKNYCENRIMGREANLPWFRVTHSGVPKDLGWRKLLTSDPRKGLQNVSVVMMDMIRQPDQETKDKIYDNIFRHDPISEKIKERFATPTKSLVQAFNKAKYQVDFRKYAPDTLQGVSFPLYEGKTYRVKTNRDGSKDKDSVLTLYYEGLCSAPISLADHMVARANILQNEKDDYTRPRNLDRILSIQEDKEYLDTVQDIVRVEAFDNLSDLSEHGCDQSRVEIPQIVGSIGVIPSPGMKDRVIANPNPAVQSSLYNLGEFLGNVTKNHPCCFVYDQQAGIRKIQAHLERGIELASIDMTAATDRLSADAGWELISNLIDHSNKGFYEKEHLRADLDYFKEVSRSAFYCGHLGDDNVNYISYTQGQPMGLKPSFPMLTLMNIRAGIDASMRVPGSIAPIVVGDDIVIDRRCLDHYLETIQGLGGVINLDKTLVSNTHAKFCSRLISKDEVIREKPRYVHGDRMRNALQLGNLNLLKPWEKNIALSAASQSIDDLDLINVNIDKAPLVDRITDRAIQRLMDNGLDSSLYILQPEIAKLSLYLRSEQETAYRKDVTSEREMRLRYEMGENIPISDSLEFVSHLSEVAIPVKVTKYDHHNDRRTQVKGEVQRIRKIAKSSKSNEVSNVSFDYHNGDLLYDKSTALFQPYGSDSVIDITPTLREEQQTVVNEMTKSPLSRKRRAIPTDFLDLLEEEESRVRNKDNDEYSL